MPDPYTAGLDQVRLAFDANGLFVLNIVLGFVMFGVALDLSLGDLVRLARDPKAPAIGLVVQFLVLPAATFALIQVLRPPPSVALGMLLVASCPGGNVSNFLTHVARGSVSVSVGMTAVSTLAAIVSTPLNLSFWGSLDPGTAALLTAVRLDPVEMLQSVALLLGVPAALGMLVAAKAPAVAARLRRPMKLLSIAFFFVFVSVAFAQNFEFFLRFVGHVFVPVLIMNSLALALGYGAAALGGLPEADRRAVSIEIGIQNSGLGLILVFGFFDGLGGAAVVAAWWGIWHILSGFTLATFWARRPAARAVAQAA